MKSPGRFDHNIAWQVEQVADNYDGRRFSSLPGRLYDAMEKRAIRNALAHAQRTTQIQKILDVPCGTGRISKWLLDSGYQVECGDISREMMEVAKRRIGDSSGLLGFDVIDVYDIARDSAVYDCVTCIRLFQHLQTGERAAALKELARVSKRYVIVNVMYTSPYYGAVRKLRQLLGRYAPRYTAGADDLRRETEAASLRIVRRYFSQPGYGGNLVLLLEKK